MENFDDGMLIDLVRQFTCLWDNQSPHFKDKRVKENAWTTISETLGIPVDICQTRWQALRQRFVKETKIIKTIPSGAGKQSPGWHLYNAIDFLGAVVKERNTKGNITRNARAPTSSHLLSSPECLLSPTPTAWDSLSEMISSDSNVADDEGTGSQGFDEGVAKEVQNNEASYTVETAKAQSSSKHCSLYVDVGQHSNNASTNLDTMIKKRQQQIEIMQAEVPAKKKKNPTVVAAETLSTTINHAFGKIETMLSTNQEEQTGQDTINFSFGRTIAFMLNEMEPSQQIEIPRQILLLLATHK